MFAIYIFFQVWQNQKTSLRSVIVCILTKRFALVFVYKGCLDKLGKTFTAGKFIVNGRRINGITLKTFLAMGPAVSKLAPSAANLNCKNIVTDVRTGNAQKGSATVRSLNQRKPPCIIDSSGRFAIPRRPRNIDMKMGNWTCGKRCEIDDMVSWWNSNIKLNYHNETLQSSIPLSAKKYSPIKNLLASGYVGN